MTAASFDPAAVASLAPARSHSLEGKVAAVTGAAGGIGRWLCAGLGAAGARVLATDMNEAGLGEVCGVLRDSVIESAPFCVDLCEDDAPEGIVEATIEQFGRIDILINCAAVNRRMPLLDVDRDTYELIMSIDLRVPFFLAQAAARRMREQGAGGILHISSVNALFGLERVGVYGPAKAALSQLTQVMATEWAQYGIRVNAIAPGFIATPLAGPMLVEADRRRWILNRVPSRRFGRPDELVGIALLLLSEAGSFITGQTVVVDGGFLAGGNWFTPDQ